MGALSFSLFGARIVFADGWELTVSAADCSVCGFTFRLSPEDAGIALLPARVISCRISTNRETMRFSLRDFTVSVEERDKYRVLYRVSTDDREFMSRMREMIRDLSAYTEMKSRGEDSRISSICTGWEPEGETDFAESFCSRRFEQLHGLSADEAWLPAASAVPQTAVTLYDGPSREKFCLLGMEEYWQTRLRQAGLEQHPIACLHPECVYIGSPFCRNMMPKKAELEKLLCACALERMQPVLVFPPAAEEDLDRYAEMLGFLRMMEYGTRPELVMNDDGLARMCFEQHPGEFVLTAGTVLIRRRRDARMKFWTGDRSLLSVSSSDSEAFRGWLNRSGFTSASAECCGYEFSTHPGDVLHLPFYQMNTATACTLRAVCRTGRRGYQTEDSGCTRECERFSFMYGRETGITARFNSLFGLDRRALTEGEYLAKLSRGARRLVADLL